MALITCQHSTSIDGFIADARGHSDQPPRLAARR
jgi:hypothetical protein